jgi:hypothetical protein
MLARIFKRIADPPRCIELDVIDTNQKPSFFLCHSENSRVTKNLPYIIEQQAYGRGLLSIASAVVCHLHVAHRYQLKPYVDLRSHYSEYKDSEYESSDQCITDNPWEYFFKPVSDLAREDLMQTSFSLHSSVGFPSGYPRKMLISQVQSLRDIAATYLQPVDAIQKDVDVMIQQLRSGGPVLGVHFRGQEQKTMPYHPLSPTRSQIFSAIDRAFDLHGFVSIFFATEDLDYHDMLKTRYGNRINCMPHFRTRSPVNAYRIHPRFMHRYLLGREILTDTLILSRCDGLVSSISNVTEIARSINNGRYNVDLVIDNGLNVKHPRLASHLWKIKRCLPASMGGFSEDAIVGYPSIQ